MAASVVVPAQTIEEFVKSVDDIPLRAEVLTTVTTAIVNVGFDHAYHLADTPTAQIDKLAESVQGPASGLAKRTFQMSNNVQFANHMRLSVDVNGKALTVQGGGPGLGAPTIVFCLLLASLGLTRQLGLSQSR